MTDLFSILSHAEELSALPLCENTISGTACYTDILCELTGLTGGIFGGFNEKNEISALIYSNGACRSVIHGDEADIHLPIFLKSEKDVFFMKYTGDYPEDEKGVLVADDLSKTRHICNLLFSYYSPETKNVDIEKMVYIMFTRTRKNFAEHFFMTNDEGEAVATGGVVALNKKYAHIGDIYTLPEYRNKGYAQSILNASVRFALSRWLVPILACEPDLIGYYEKRGFTVTNEKL